MIVLKGVIFPSCPSNKVIHVTGGRPTRPSRPTKPPKPPHKPVKWPNFHLVDQQPSGSGSSSHRCVLMNFIV